MNNQASVFNPAKVPDLTHIICLYVDGISSADYQHVQGQWNATSSIQSAFIVGNGTDDGNRSNLIYAHDSTVEITGSLNVSGNIIQNGVDLNSLMIAYAIALG